MLGSKVRTRALARGIGLVAIAWGVAAAAQPAGQIDVNASAAASHARTRIVATRDLDLSGQAGRHRLDERLRAAAAWVCDARDASVVKRYDGFTGCYNSALAGGRAQAERRLAAGDGAIRVTGG